MVVYVVLQKQKGMWKHFILSQNIQQQKWIDFMNMPNWQALPNSKLCSKHFSADCFDRPGKITKLISMAVPTIKFERFE
ncbi:THAP domain-containing protein 2-like [Odontomachus brunneus]|uniref:THAP domain-containing protein 2-like n=1 Tax=Odontomachus brunneus TaxID=486640 RepID=UPI0013F23378|nr:THAP domain-containing protein 2-like [Odontomachus brunneus]